MIKLSKNLSTLLSRCSHNCLRRKESRGQDPSKKSKGKRKERESSSSTNTESEEHSNSEPPKSSSEEGDNIEDGSRHSKRMSELEQRLEALANRGCLQDVGII